MIAQFTVCDYGSLRTNGQVQKKYMRQINERSKKFSFMYLKSDGRHRVSSFCLWSKIRVQQRRALLPTIGPQRGFLCRTPLLLVPVVVPRMSLRHLVEWRLRCSSHSFLKNGYWLPGRFVILLMWLNCFRTLREIRTWQTTDSPFNLMTGRSGLSSGHCRSVKNHFLRYLSWGRSVTPCDLLAGRGHCKASEVLPLVACANISSF